jgi:hypothetical protein
VMGTHSRPYASTWFATGASQCPDVILRDATSAARRAPALPAAMEELHDLLRAYSCQGGGAKKERQRAPVVVGAWGMRAGWERAVVRICSCARSRSWCQCVIRYRNAECRASAVRAPPVRPPSAIAIVIIAAITRHPSSPISDTHHRHQPQPPPPPPPHLHPPHAPT